MTTGKQDPRSCSRGPKVGRFTGKKATGAGGEQAGLMPGRQGESGYWKVVHPTEANLAPGAAVAEYQTRLPVWLVGVGGYG